MQKPRSLRERAAQLLMPRLGSNMPPPVSVEEDAGRVGKLLERVPVGGVVLFRGSAASTPAALERLQRLSPFPLLVGSDLERGAGQQLAGSTVFPHAMAFGGLGQSGTECVRTAATITAIQARQAGVQWLFAPVADVHSNPANPIISTRAYGSDPLRCGELVQAFVKGCRDGGGLSTAKHFPGHGDTDTDSHEVVPSVSRPRAVLDRLELAPFRAAIAAGVDSIMTAHVSYPDLDASGQPATFSAPILRDLLRGEMGFQGVVVSDSLLMGGAGEAASARAPELVAAGVDVLLDISHPEIALDSLVSAVESGDLKEALLEAAFQRVWSMKQRALRPLEPPPTPSAQRFSRKIAANALRVTGDASSVLSRPGPVPVFVVRPHVDYPDPTKANAEDILAGVSDRMEVETVGPEASDFDRARRLERAERAGRAVLTLVVKPAAWHKFGLLAAQVEFASEVIQRVPTVVCLLGSPDSDRALPAATARIVAFSDVSVSVEAVASVLRNALGSA